MNYLYTFLSESLALSWLLGDARNKLRTVLGAGRLCCTCLFEALFHVIHGPEFTVNRTPERLPGMAQLPSERHASLKPLDLPRFFKGTTFPVLDTSLQDVLFRTTTEPSSFYPRSPEVKASGQPT